MKKLAKNRFSITHTSIFFSSVFMLTLMLVTIVSFLMYQNILVRQSTNLAERLDMQVVEKIDNYVSDIIELTKIPLYDEQLMLSLEYDSDFDNQELSYRIETLMFSNFFSKQNVYAISLFNENNDVYSRTVTRNYNYDGGIKERDFYNKANERGKVYVVPTHKIHELEGLDSYNPQVFSVYRKLFSVRTGNFCGSILVSAQVEFIKKICEQIQIFPNHRIVISDTEDNVIFDTNGAAGIKLSDDIKALHAGRMKIDGNENRVSEYAIEKAGWKLKSIVPVSEIKKEADNVGRLVLTLNVSVFTLLCLFNAFLFTRLNAPLKGLVKKISMIKNGDSNVLVTVEGNDEISQLSEGFNEMLTRVKNLITEIHKAEIKQKNLEIKALQRQINPHFINNTIESIYMMSIINNDTKISEMTSAFGRVVRYGISDSRSFVSVRDEIDHLNEYLFIQKIRFANRLSISFDIDEDILDKKIIKLVLQPIVENSIQYGIELLDVNEKITISGFSGDDKLIFIIRDDGAGIEEERLSEIIEKINDFDSEFSSIGLRNVNERIKLSFGNDYGIQIHSEKNKGTSVKLVLPNLPKEDIAYD